MSALRVYGVSLGCPKTRVDTEHLLGALGGRAAIQPVETPEEAELVFINTCGFIQPAVEESIQTILEAAGAMAGAAEGKRPLLAVAGCLVSRYPDQLAPELPEVDLWLPLDAMDRWPLLVAQALGRPLGTAPSGAAPRLRSTPPGYAYLKISEGCDHGCSFCAIPSIRGRLKSAPATALVDEAKALVDEGVREIILVAQDLLAYGRDRKDSGALFGLLESLAALPGLARLRPMYLYPAALTDDALRRLAQVGPPLLPYFDVPLQHAHPDILKMMGRPFAADPMQAVERIRAHFPGAAIRSSLIVGFPGETEAHFQHVLDFVARARLNHLGVFPYWPEEGTRAAELPGQLPAEEKEARVARVMALQREISAELLEAQVGSELEVLVDEPQPDWPGLFTGRAWFQAPEVDGVVYISGDGLQPGQLVSARVEEAKDFDLVALV